MLIITTESGTAYEVDMDAMTVTRRGGSPMRRDGEVLGIDQIDVPVIGQPLVMVLEKVGEAAHRTVRVTTNVVSIVETVTCRTCHRPITHDGTVWVDDTEGDVCMDNDGNDGQHMPTTEGKD